MHPGMLSRAQSRRAECWAATRDYCARIARQAGERNSRLIGSARDGQLQECARTSGDRGASPDVRHLYGLYPGKPDHAEASPALFRADARTPRVARATRRPALVEGWKIHLCGAPIDGEHAYENRRARCSGSWTREPRRT